MSQVSESPVKQVEFVEADPQFGRVLRAKPNRINLVEYGVLVAYIDPDTMSEHLRLIPWHNVRAVQFREM